MMIELAGLRVVQENDSLSFGSWIGYFGEQENAEESLIAYRGIPGELACLPETS
jgi:hypothetical protein